MASLPGRAVKVYLVFEGSYEDRVVMYVFTSRELAEAYVKAAADGRARRDYEAAKARDEAAGLAAREDYRLLSFDEWLDAPRTSWGFWDTEQHVTTRRQEYDYDGDIEECDVLDVLP